MRKKIWVAAAAVIFGLLVGCSVYFGWFGYAELFYEDILYQSENSINNKIKIVAIDDKTLADLGDYGSWTRQNYANLIDTLCTESVSPEVIVFDIMFPDEKDEAGDLAFVESCKRAGNVVIAAKINTTVSFDEATGTLDTYHVTECIVPYEALRPYVRLGYPNIILDNDGYVRHAMPAVMAGETEYYSLSAQASLFYMEKTGSKPVLPRKDSFLIDYSASPGSYEMISMSDVITGKVPASVFDDCIVLVGGCSEGLMDSYSVPIDRRTLMYGIEINANIVQAILDCRFPEYANILPVAIFMGMFAGIFLYVTNRHSIRFMTIGLVAALGLHATLCMLLIRNGIILPILYMTVAYPLAYLLNLIWKYADERKQRMKEMRELMFSMAEAMTEAIDGRTPYNASHTRNVASYAVSLAEYLNTKKKSGETALHLSKNEVEQLHLAALLHDVGKLDVPTEVLDKPSRLGHHEIQFLERMELLRLSVRLDAAQTSEDCSRMLNRLDEMISFIRQANQKEWISDEERQRIDEWKACCYHTEDGREIPYLTEEEYRCLLIRKGTLTDEEMEKVHSHVVYTDKILGKVTFGRHYEQVKTIAASHHELLNGKGYPNHLKEDEISLSVRILTIADVYDALTADDRPYKRAKTKEETFRILHMMEKSNEIDGEVLKFAEELWGQ